MKFSTFLRIRQLPSFLKLENIVFPGFFWVFIISASDISAQTLSEVILTMLKYEPELLGVDADSRSSFQDMKMVNSERFPHVAVFSNGGFSRRDRSTDGLVSSSAGSLFSRDIGVSLRQLLYDGGDVKCRTVSARESYRAQRFLQMGMIEQRVVDLAEVHMELIRIEEQMKAARDHLATYREFRKKLVRREEQGGIRSDTTLIDGRLSLAENTLETLQLSKENAESRFLRLTGQKPGRRIKPNIPRIDQGDADFSGNWDYLAACATLKSAQAKLSSVQKAYHPDVYFDAGATRGQDTIGVQGKDSEIHALVGVSMDLYKGGYRKAHERREHWQVVRARELLEAARVNSEHISRDLFSERKGSESSRKSLGKYVDRLDSVSSDYRKQFDIGNRELLNLLDIIIERYEANSKLIDARFNAETSNYRIMGKQGKLISHLVGNEISKHIGMGETSADKWYCDIKNNSKCVANDCRKLGNCAPEKVLTPVVCTPCETKASDACDKSYDPLQSSNRVMPSAEARKVQKPLGKAIRGLFGRRK